MCMCCCMCSVDKVHHAVLNYVEPGERKEIMINNIQQAIAIGKTGRGTRKYKFFSMVSVNPH